MPTEHSASDASNPRPRGPAHAEHASIPTTQPRRQTTSQVASPGNPEPPGNSTLRSQANRRHLLHALGSFAPEITRDHAATTGGRPGGG